MYSILVCVWVQVCKGWNPVNWPSSTDIFLHQPSARHSTHQQNHYNNHHYDSCVHWSVFTLLKLHKQRRGKILRCDKSRMWNVKMYCIIPRRLTQILSAVLTHPACTNGCLPSFFSWAWWHQKTALTILTQSAVWSYLCLKFNLQ